MNKNKTEHKSVCVTIEKQDHERLARMAWETGRTVPGYIRWLVNQHLRETDTQKKSI